MKKVFNVDRLIDRRDGEGERKREGREKERKREEEKERGRERERERERRGENGICYHLLFCIFDVKPMLWNQISY